MNRNDSFGGWFMMIVLLAFLIGVLLHIGSNPKTIEAYDGMRVLYYKAISGAI